MPKGPKGEKRPGDVIGAAVKVMKIATGEDCMKTRPAADWIAALRGQDVI